MTGNYLEEILIWQRKRTRTFITFTVLNVLLGMEYSMIDPSVHTYLADTVHCNRPSLFSHLIRASYFASLIITGLCFGRYADLTRKTWLANQFGNILLLMGNLMYAMYVPSSIVFPFAGRILSGMGAALRVLTFAEICRQGSQKEVARYVPMQCWAYSMGITAGPAINLLFRDINFSVGGWQINRWNIPGLFMAVAFLITQIVSFFMVHDIAFEGDTPSHRLLRETNFKNCYGALIPDLEIQQKLPRSSRYISKVQQNTASQSFIWKRLLTNPDWLILMSMTFLFGITVSSFDIWLPLTVIERLQYGPGVLSAVIVGTLIMSASMVFVLAWKPLSKKYVYLSYILTIIGTIVVLGTLLVLNMRSANRDLNDALLVVYALLIPFILYTHQFPAMSVCWMTLPSTMGYAQGIQHGFYRIGGVLGVLLSPIAYESFTETVVVMLLLSSCLLLCISIRRKSLSDPTCIF